MVENALEQQILKPRDKATDAIVQLLRQNPASSMSDIRELVGTYYQRKYATGAVFEYILDRILSEYVQPQLSKSEATSLRQKKVHFQMKEVEKARIDELTGLPRRRLFTEILTIEKQYHTKWTFLLLDIDNFKQCNTAYGLKGGDSALQAVARLLKASMNHETESIIGRWGGEEFIVAIPAEMNNLDERIAALREAYQQAIHRIFVKPDDTFRGTFSIGRYDHDFSKGDISIDDVVNRADDALYIAKTTGKNKSIVWDENTPVRPMKR